MAGPKYPAFNVTIIRQEPYWVGDIFDGKNTAVQFTYGTFHFMIVNIEYNANATVLDWMQTLIKTNPDVNVIVATHNFLNGAGGTVPRGLPTQLGLPTSKSYLATTRTCL